MISYRSASPADYCEILGLNEAAIPAVNRIDSTELAALHGQAEALIVAGEENGVAGFLLALNETGDYASLNFQYFKQHFDRFVYVDRIVVSDAHRRKGIGAGLYDALFRLTPEARRITCEVNVKPPNPESLAFHAGLGFEIVDEQDTDGGAKRVALMVRNGQIEAP